MKSKNKIKGLNFYLEQRAKIWVVVGKDWVRPANSTEIKLWNALVKLNYKFLLK